MCGVLNDCHSSNLASCDCKDQTLSLNCLVLDTVYIIHEFLNVSSLLIILFKLLLLYRMLCLDNHVLVLCLWSTLIKYLWNDFLWPLYVLIAVRIHEFCHSRSMCLVNNVYKYYKHCTRIYFLWSALPTAPHRLKLWRTSRHHLMVSQLSYWVHKEYQYTLQMPQNFYFMPFPSVSRGTDSLSCTILRVPQSSSETCNFVNVVLQNAALKIPQKNL